MACCIALLRLLAPLLAKAGIDHSTPPRVPVVPLAICGVLEITAALAITAAYGPSFSSPSLGASMTSGHAAHASTATTPGHSDQTVLVGLALVCGIVVMGASMAAAHRLNHRIAALGALSGVAALVLAQLRLASQSHLAVMVIIEAALVVCPLAILGLTPHAGRHDDVWVTVRGAIATLAAIAVIFVLVSFHLPATHHWYSDDGRLAWWSTPVFLLLGTIFWSAILRFRLPAAWRSTLLALVFETGAVIGLVLLVANEPLMEMEHTPMGQGLHLSEVADQRLAGVLMMAIDLLVVVQALRAGFRRGDPWIPTSPIPSVAKYGG